MVNGLTAGQDLAQAPYRNGEEGADEEDVADIGVDAEHRADQCPGEAGQEGAGDEDLLVDQPDVQPE